MKKLFINEFTLDDHNKVLEKHSNKRVKKIIHNFYCEKCQSYEDLYIYDDGSKFMLCKCDDRIKINPKKYKLIKYFNSISEIPIIHKNSNFDNFNYNNDLELRNLYQGAKHFVMCYNKEKKETLVLRGTIGSGKTHIAIACMKEFEKRNLSVYFITFSSFMQKIKESFDAGNQARLLQDIHKCDVLILDDIGIGKLTEYEIKQLYDIVDKRQSKINIYTTNMSNKELTASKEWKRITSRMFNRFISNVISVRASDYRMKVIN